MQVSKKTRNTICEECLLLLPCFLALSLFMVRGVRTYLWRDEFATIGFSSLSPSELLHAVLHVDFVYFPYYLIINTLVHVSDNYLVIRLPSIIAGVGTVALVSRLARRWWGLGPGLIAGLALSINPMFFQEATEARSYALATFFSFLAAFIPIKFALERVTVICWIAYSAALGLAGFMHLFSLLVVIAHACLLIRHGKRVRLFFVGSLASVAVVMLPFVYATHHQAFQIGWIPRPALKSVFRAMFDIIGDVSSWKIDALDIPIVVLFFASVALILGRILFLEKTARTDWIVKVCFCLLLAGGPCLILFVFSRLVVPVLVSRYLCPSTTGVALTFGAATSALIGFHKGETASGTFRLRPKFWVVLASVFLLVALYPISGRLALAKVHGDDFPALTEALKSKTSPGDVIAIHQSVAETGFAIGIAYYSSDVQNLSEILSRLPDGTQPRMDLRSVTSTRPFETSSLSRSRPVSRVWFISLNGEKLSSKESANLEEHGCKTQEPVLSGVYGDDSLQFVGCARAPA